MEFIGFGGIINWPLILGIAVLSALVLLGGVRILQRNPPGAKAKGGLRLLGLIMAILGGLWILFPLAYGAAVQLTTTQPSDQDIRLPQIKNEILASYDLPLSDKQVTELKYPLREPDSGYTRFGTTSIIGQSNKGLKELKVTLLWDGSKLLLATPGEDHKLTPLKIRK